MTKPALLGGEPVTRAADWPTWPQWDDREREALADVLESGRWQAGPQVEAFEAEFAAYQGASNALAVTNGTSSMVMVLRAAGVGPGDEVIIPSYTFIATALAPMALGAVPVLVDCDPETTNIDPDAVRLAVTERTKAMIPVHVGGRPSDVDALHAIAREHRLLVLEDAAHAHGAEWRGQRIGAFGDVASFSFQTGKSMTAGDGGCLVTPSDELARDLASIRDFGRGHAGETVRVGGNFRMTEFQAAVLRCQLLRLDEQIAVRQRNVEALRSELAQVPGVRLAETDPRVTREPHYQVVIHLDEDEFGLSKQRVLEALAAEGVPLEPGYSPLHRLPFLRDASRSGVARVEPCPISEILADHQVLWLSFRMALATPQQVSSVVEALVKIQRHAEELR